MATWEKDQSMLFIDFSDTPSTPEWKRGRSPRGERGLKSKYTSHRSLWAIVAPLAGSAG